MSAKILSSCQAKKMLHKKDTLSASNLVRGQLVNLVKQDSGLKIA